MSGDYYCVFSGCFFLVGWMEDKVFLKSFGMLFLFI